jgi:hypothetical protein
MRSRRKSRSRIGSIRQKMAGAAADGFDPAASEHAGHDGSQAEFPQCHDPPDILKARQRIVPQDRTCFEIGQHMFDPAGKITKLIPRQVHQFGNRPDKHRFLHRLTAPIAAF